MLREVSLSVSLLVTFAVSSSFEAKTFWAISVSREEVDSSYYLFIANILLCQSSNCHAEPPRNPEPREYNYIEVVG